jgi:AcrR family transcriptional regulator
MAQTGGGVGTKGVPRADREQQILDAAVAEFGGRGYAHASMAAIAQRAGISKPLVYEYFGSKEGLYLACLSRAGTHLVDRVAAAQGGTTLRRAGDTLAAIFGALDGRRLDWAVIFDPTLPAGSAVREAARGYQAQLHRMAVEGTREVLGGYGLADADDNALTSHVWSAVVTAVVSWWLGHPDETAAAMTERCARLIAALSAAGRDPRHLGGPDSGTRLDALGGTAPRPGITGGK